MSKEQNKQNTEQDAEAAYDDWFSKHGKKANDNGWCIYRSSHGYQIQGSDEEGVSDEEAWVRVHRGVLDGDRSCVEALVFLRNHAPDEYTRVCRYEKEAEKDFAVVIIKPDAFDKGVYSDIFHSICSLPDVNLRGCLMTRPGREFFEKFYEDKKTSPFFKDLCDFMDSGSVLLMLVYGEKVIARLRKLVGATDSSKADPSTLRWRYGSHTVIRKNVVHCSSNWQEARREWRLVRNEIVGGEKPW